MTRTRHAGLAFLAVPVLASLAHAQCPPQQLDPNPTASSYGLALAMSGRHLIVGDPHDSSLCPSSPLCSNGTVYAYEKDASGHWVLTQEVRPASLVPAYGFGGALDIAGDRLIVGSGGPGAGGGVGAAFIFEYDGEEWVGTAELRGESDHIGFGAAVAVHGNNALVATSRSNAYVFQYDDATWERLGLLPNPDSPGVRSDFGRALDIDERRVVIGAYLERTIAPDGGAVYVYLRQPDGTLELEQKLVAPDVMSGPRFGTSVSLDGERLAVGAENGIRRRSAQGVVYMHEFIDGQWRLVQELVADDPVEAARFGQAVHLLGDKLAVGAYSLRQPAFMDRSGAAYLFERDADGRWSQSAQYLPEAWEIDLGWRVALGAGEMVATAPRTFVDGMERGSAHVYDLGCEDCPPDLDADGTLTIFDFLTFLNLFDDGDAQADFDGDGELTIFDFLAFQTAFDVGCE